MPRRSARAAQTSAQEKQRLRCATCFHSRSQKCGRRDALVCVLGSRCDRGEDSQRPARGDRTAHQSFGCEVVSGIFFFFFLLFFLFCLRRQLVGAMSVNPYVPCFVRRRWMKVSYVLTPCFSREAVVSTTYCRSATLTGLLPHWSV